MRDNHFLSKQVCHFLALYEAGTVRLAADRLGMSQPALSISLKQLEEELGKPLFERSHKGISPTQAGETYYRFANAARLGASYAAQELLGEGREFCGVLRIGLGVAFTSTIAPKLLSRLAREYPDMSIELVSGVADRLLDLFEAGKLDIALALGFPLHTADPELRTDFIGATPMIAVAHKDHPLTKNAYVTIEDLASTPWVGFYEDDTFVSDAASCLARYGVTPPKIILRTNSIDVLFEFVRREGNVTLLSDLLFERAQAAGLRKLELEAPLWTVPIGLRYRSFALSLAPLRRFRELLQNELKTKNKIAE